MFDLQVTNIGWQGWVLQTPRTSIGIDLLLVQDIGRGPPATRLQLFWHPRAFKWDAFPRLDSFVLTHEHEDHFNIPSLARLDRSIPIYLSSRASTAATTILSEMGFRSVHSVCDGQTITIGDIVIEFFGNTEIEPGSDEWDTLAFFARAPGGSFFTEVDTWLTPAMQSALDRRSVELGEGGDVLCSLGMAMSLWPPPNLKDLQQKSRAPVQATPFTGDYAASLEALRTRCNVGVHPGMTVRMAGHRVCDIGPSEYLESSLEVLPGRRPFRKREEDRIAPPLTGEPELSPREMAELARHLQEIAEHLYGRDLPRMLIQLGSPPDMIPSFVLALHVGTETTIYEYHSQSCNFRRIPATLEAVKASHAGVVELWARDLLSLGRGEIEPRMLGHQVHETWRGIRHQFWRDLWLFYHPQRFPERVLEQYRRILEEVGDEPRMICYAGSSARSAR